MRPKKYIKARYLTICLDDKDVEFLDDHRGKVTRGDYLIHSMYALRPEQSDQLKETKEKDQQKSQEIHELKKQKMFLEDKLKKYESTQAQDDPQLNEWFKGIEPCLRDMWNKNRGAINWSHIFGMNPHLGFKTAVDLKRWVTLRIEDGNNEVIPDNRPDTEYFPANNPKITVKNQALTIL